MKVLISILFILATQLLATQRALLVGVTKYPNLDTIFHLQGPENDVNLIRRVLIQRGFDSTKIWQYTEKSVQKPDRKVILKALERMADSSARGDLVYMHFSGHGSLAHTNDTIAEPDGFDELFLARDASQWDDKVGTVPGAIADDEFGAAIDRIRAKGASVVVAFDACHSGTMTRGGADSIRFRMVPSTLLTANKTIKKTVTERAVTKELAPLVSIYAVGSHQKAPEAYLPFDPDVPRHSYGLLSYTLATALLQNFASDYAQLGQQISQAYRSAGFMDLDPMIEGDVHLGVLQQVAGRRTAQWLIQFSDEDMSIDAGILQGVSKGQQLRVYPNAEAPDSTAMECVEVMEAELFRSVIKQVSCNGDSVKTDIPEFAWARKVDQEIQWDVRTKLGDWNGLAGSEKDRLKKELSKMLDSLNVTVVDSKSIFETSIDVDSLGNWSLKLLNADGSLIQDFNLKKADLSSLAKVKQWFVKVRKFLLLQRVLFSERKDSSIAISVQSRSSINPRKIQADSLLVLENDTVVLSHTNTSDEIMSMHILVMNPKDLSIFVIPFGELLRPKQKGEFKLPVDSDRDRLFLAVLGLPVDKNSPAPNLSSFSQSGIKVRSKGAAKQSNHFTQLFVELSESGDSPTHRTRGFDLRPPKKGPIRIIEVKTNW